MQKVCSNVFVFFFKQKTAYEMRISDWSSDVCSSDLACRQGEAVEGTPRARPRRAGHGDRCRRARCRCAGGRAARCCGEYRQGNRRGLAQARRGLLSGQVTRHCARTSSSEERRVGKARGSKGRSRWEPYHTKKKMNNNRR